MFAKYLDCSRPSWLKPGKMLVTQRGYHYADCQMASTQWWEYSLTIALGLWAIKLWHDRWAPTWGLLTVAPTHSPLH